MLSENPGLRGLVLWQIWNDVYLWAESPPTARANLFCSDALGRRAAQVAELPYDEDLEVALPSLANALYGDEFADFETVSAMCDQVSRWAQKHARSATAWSFTVLAAVVSPRDCNAALRTAEIAAARGTPLAELWYRRVIGLGRRRRDWLSYAKARLGLGLLAEHQGNLATAKRWVTGALRAARREHGMSHLRGEALRALSRIQAGSGDYENAKRYLDLASRVYSLDHPQRATVDEERAALWIRMGNPSRASALLQTVLRKRTEAVGRARALALLALAGAAQSNRLVYQRNSNEAWQIIAGRLDATPFISALATLCEAADLAGDLIFLRMAVDTLTASNLSGDGPTALMNRIGNSLAVRGGRDRGNDLL